MYRYVIFDADHTLIDFYADERAAFRRTFSHFGAKYTEEDVERARKASDEAWAAAGLNDVHLENVQAAFHRTYFCHIPSLFRRVRAFLPLDGSDEEFADYFAKELYTPAHPVGDALGVCKRLSQRYEICIATNGITAMQRARLKDFLPYTRALFVSEEMGVIKPNAAFFSGMLSKLGAAPEECLFVGDSLSSDIRGCLAAGIPCLWFNPAGLPLPDDCRGVQSVASLNELEKIL